MASPECGRCISSVRFFILHSVKGRLLLGGLQYAHFSFHPAFHHRYFFAAAVLLSNIAGDAN